MPTDLLWRCDDFLLARNIHVPQSQGLVRDHAIWIRFSFDRLSSTHLSFDPLFPTHISFDLFTPSQPKTTKATQSNRTHGLLISLPAHLHLATYKYFYSTIPRQYAGDEEVVLVEPGKRRRPQKDAAQRTVGVHRAIRCPQRSRTYKGMPLTMSRPASSNSCFVMHTNLEGKNSNRYHARCHNNNCNKTDECIIKCLVLSSTCVCVLMICWFTLDNTMRFEN